MILNRRKTRTILNTTETTEQTASINTAALSFVLLTTDSFYIGFFGKFASRYFSFTIPNTNAATLSVEFWDGTAWAPVLDIVDQTNGFTQSGFVSWINEETWKKSEQAPITSASGTDSELYWIRIKTDTNFSAGTELQSVLNLFSDDELVRPLYPEIITDSRFLPPGRTDFLEQHQQAKARVIRRLNQKGILKDESQIIDINQVSEAAVHAFADIVLSPIATSDNLIEILNRAKANFESELTRVNLGVDLNKDGIVTENEQRVDSGRLFRR
jgi:hypothetical protein